MSNKAETTKQLARLREHHLRQLRESGLNDETIIASGFYTEDRPAAIASILNRRTIKKSCGAALVMPYRDATGELNGFKRCKLDNPRKSQGKPVKYESPSGSTNHVFVPIDTFKVLREPKQRMLLTEGEKKALKADQEGFPCIGLIGVYGWKDKRSERLLPELEVVDWNGREVIVVFDSDVTTKPEVQDAEARLAAQLRLLGADVKVVRLPNEPDGEKNGIDDFLVRYGKDELYRLIKKAEVPEPPDAGIVKMNARNIDAVFEARRILMQTQHDGLPTIQHHRSEWWRWKAGRYILTTDDEVKAAVYKALDPVAYKITSSTVGNIVSALKAETQRTDSREMPFWIDRTGPNRVLSFSNGLVDLDAITRAEDAELMPHTPAWFSTVRLPYPFDPAAECPRWEQVVRNNLCGDQQLIDVFQEFAGYMFYPSAEFQKFMVMEGEGNNGKSVFLAVLRAIIGHDNISAVPLENFGGRFALSATLGKLVNIVAECGEMDRDRVAEGHLKSFTAGDAMEFERKHKPSFSAIPTARLILATNNRPRFSDKSGGLWRRMILIPMVATIADDQRVIGMDRADWWQQQGDLPGIFNWAMVGLRRLLTNRKFTDSAAVDEAIADYKADMNPARDFLLSYYVEHPNHNEAKCDVYASYKQWCQDNGHNRPMSARSFGREVVRTFKNIINNQKVYDSHGRRVDGYHGLAKADYVEPPEINF